MQAEINYWAVLVGAIIYYAGGALWYSPVLFGKAWMAEVGLTAEKIEATKKDNWKSYLTALVAALVISFGLARLMGYLEVSTLAGGLHTGFWSWLAFVMTTAATNNAFAGRSLKLYLIDGGYHLYGFMVMGIILALWR
jgi:hypothetical protein